MAPEATDKQEYKRKYYAANRDRIAARSKRNYSAKADHYRAYARERRLADPEASNRARAYYAAHPEKGLHQNAMQRAKKLCLPFTITSDDVKACIPPNGLCPITLLPFERGPRVGPQSMTFGPQSMTLDRLMPEKGYVPGNIAIVSYLANTMKNTCTDAEVFRRLAAYVEGSLRTPLGASVVTPPEWMLVSARGRAKERGQDFRIVRGDILACVPSDGCCPITRRPLQIGKGKVGPDSMSLDRVDPMLGYTPGNIAVISHLANTIKQNCTDPEVFRRLAGYVESGGHVF
jgi:hypothetical protein